MVVMNEQALEAHGVAAFGARRKMLKTIEVVRKKFRIDDPTALPPPQPPSAGLAPASPASNQEAGWRTVDLRDVIMAPRDTKNFALCLSLLLVLSSDICVFPSNSFTKNVGLVLFSLFV